MNDQISHPARSPSRTFSFSTVPFWLTSYSVTQGRSLTWCHKMPQDAQISHSHPSSFSPSSSSTLRTKIPMTGRVVSAIGWFSHPARSRSTRPNPSPARYQPVPNPFQPVPALGCRPGQFPFQPRSSPSGSGQFPFSPRSAHQPLPFFFPIIPPPQSYSNSSNKKQKKTNP